MSGSAGAGEQVGDDHVERCVRELSQRGARVADANPDPAHLPSGPPLAHTRRRVATARALFSDAALIADAAVLRGRRFGNLVLAAADGGLPEPDLARLLASDPFPARLLHGDELATFAAGAPPITDAHAELSPVPPPGVFAP